MRMQTSLHMLRDISLIYVHGLKVWSCEQVWQCGKNKSGVNRGLLDIFPGLAVCVCGFFLKNQTRQNPSAWMITQPGYLFEVCNDHFLKITLSGLNLDKKLLRQLVTRRVGKVRQELFVFLAQGSHKTMSDWLWWPMLISGSFGFPAILSSARWFSARLPKNHIGGSMKTAPHNFKAAHSWLVHLQLSFPYRRFELPNRTS